MNRNQKEIEGGFFHHVIKPMGLPLVIIGFILLVLGAIYLVFSSKLLLVIVVTILAMKGFYDLLGEVTGTK